MSAGALASEATRLAAEGRTVSWLVETPGGSAAQLLGLLAFGDTLKASARPAIERLHALGVRCVMVTGDNAGSAGAVAAALGLDEVHADVLPEHKAQVIAQLKRDGAVVAMVGDGINDAPALAAADVGIAMGSGTDVAMQTAGITLMRGDPLRVADAIDVSRRTWSKIRQNLFWAFAYNVVGIPLAAFGLRDLRVDAAEVEQTPAHAEQGRALVGVCAEQVPGGQGRRAAEGGAQRDVRIVFRHRRADARIARGHTPLRRDHVGPALQQVGGRAHRTDGRHGRDGGLHRRSAVCARRRGRC